MNRLPSEQRLWKWTWVISPNDVREVLPPSLQDTGCPDIDNEEWVSLRLAIYLLAQDIYDLEIVVDGNRVTLGGCVTSVAARSALVALISSHGLEVTDRLRIEPVFSSASGAGDGVSRRPVDENHEFAAPLELHPTIAAESDPEPEERFRFVVDLRDILDPSTDGSVTLRGLPAGWSTIDVGVEIVAPGLSFDEGKDVGAIKVHRDGRSEAAEFLALVDPDVATISVLALFKHGGRHAGSARKEFQLRMRPALRAQSGRVAGNAPAPAAPRVSIDPGAVAPALTVAIINAGDDLFVWRYTAPPGMGEDRRTETIKITGGEEFAAKLLMRCPAARPGKHVDDLRGIGGRVWDATPQSFRNLFEGMRSAMGPDFPIQFVTNETFIPWELMHPAAGQVEGADHLFMTHPVARWFVDLEGGMSNHLPGGLLTTFTPVYSDLSTLPFAQDEGDWLVRTLGAVRGIPTYDGFTGYWGSAMPAEKVSTIHFAGHGSTGKGSDSHGAGLRMSDDWVSDDAVHDGVILGKRDGSHVVLNACSIGAGDVELGVVAGFPARLARRGFKAITAPAWAIRDGHASAVVRQYLEFLSQGRTLGVAMRDARAMHRNASSTPFAYICHGDVMAKIG